MTTDVVDAQAGPPEDADAPSAGDGVGIAAFVAGCLALGPIAIVLGLLGLARWRDGHASRRSWPLAGLILGVIATIGAFVALVLYANSGAREATTDAQAQVDAITLGNAVVGQVVADPAVQEIAVAAVDGGYDVAGVSAESSLPDDAARDVSLAFQTAYDWCLTLTYEGGTRSEVGYDSADGLVATCPEP